MEAEKRVYTVQEVAKILGISRNLAYREVQAGTIKAIRLGDRYLISSIVVNELLSGQAPVCAGK